MKQQYIPFIEQRIYDGFKLKFRKNKRTMRTICILIAYIFSISFIHQVFAVPPLKTFDTIASDSVGSVLQKSMIWTAANRDSKGTAVVFRKSFVIDQPSKSATLKLFADARYILWINGEYVDRGPSRFQPNGPQYDILDLTPHLRLGRNVAAILVVGNLSGGKIMLHDPGLTAMLDIDGKNVFKTDTTWKWKDQTRFQKVTASWANLTDSVVDARVDDGDWTQNEYDDSKWESASPISGESWGPLTATLIPRLRETEITYRLKNGINLPITLSAGEKLEFETGRIVQAYLKIDIDGQVNSELSIMPYGVKYLCKSGKQQHFTIDSRGLAKGEIVVKSGKVTINDLKVIERLYPFQRLGSFQSNDIYLNQLWEMCARSCEVLSEDSYVDCADRERVEWMDDTPPGFEITQVAMAGPGKGKELVYSDPRLLGALIRRTALTLQPEGWVKAHTCSDRYDIHANMEDRACDWIEGQRQYLDATGDATILRETWPAVVSQMNYFLDRRTSRGLVRARDWVVWGNPVGYWVGEGTTLNVFVQKALVDASYLAEVVGDKANANLFSSAAAELKERINNLLWDDQLGGYYAGYFTDEDMAINLRGNKKTTLKLKDHLAESTLHANVFALDREIVPTDRYRRVVTNTLQQEAEYKDKHIMIYHYFIKQLYLTDQAKSDTKVLNLFREKWKEMTADPRQCSWEGFGFGSSAHIYGMYPGYYLSSYVLGVRRNAPASSKRLLIEPHLGDLLQAEGTVVTEFGPVPISWKSDSGELKFKFEVPNGIIAIISLPIDVNKSYVIVNDQKVTGIKTGARLTFELEGGRYEGKY